VVGSRALTGLDVTSWDRWSRPGSCCFAGLCALRPIPRLRRDRAARSVIFCRSRSACAAAFGVLGMQLASQVLPDAGCPPRDAAQLAFCHGTGWFTIPPQLGSLIAGGRRDVLAVGRRRDRAGVLLFNATLCHAPAHDGSCGRAITFGSRAARGVGAVGRGVAAANRGQRAQGSTPGEAAAGRWRRRFARPGTVAGPGNCTPERHEAQLPGHGVLHEGVRPGSPKLARERLGAANRSWASPRRQRRVGQACTSLTSTATCGTVRRRRRAERSDGLLTSCGARPYGNRTNPLCSSTASRPATPTSKVTPGHAGKTPAPT